MPIPIFSYDRFRLKTDIFINTDTDMVLADTDMIETDTDISVSISAKNIGQPIYQSISMIYNLVKHWSNYKIRDIFEIYTEWAVVKWVRDAFKKKKKKTEMWDIVQFSPDTPLPRHFGT